MLTYEEGEGILWVSPVFAPIFEQAGCEESAVVVTLDDCECGGCDNVRGPIDPVATILLHLPADPHHVVQRLTPEEAKAIGNALLTYASYIEEMVEDEG